MLNSLEKTHPRQVGVRQGAYRLGQCVERGRFSRRNAQSFGRARSEVLGAEQSALQIEGRDLVIDEHLLTEHIEKTGMPASGRRDQDKSVR